MDVDELMHYGVKGQKWGVRRYQPYPDGKEGKFLGKKKKTYKITSQISSPKKKKKINLKKIDTTTTGQFFLTDYQDKAISPRDATEALLRSGINIKKDSTGKHRQTDKNFIDNNANENAYVKRMLADPDKRRKFYQTIDDMKMQRIEQEAIDKGFKVGSVGFEDWKHKRIYGW